MCRVKLGLRKEEQKQGQAPVLEHVPGIVGLWVGSWALQDPASTTSVGVAPEHHHQQHTEVRRGD